MIEVMLAGSVATVALAIVAVAAAFFMYRLMFRAGQRMYSVAWREVLQRIHDDPMASAVYYGAQWIGICILLGWLFSKPV